MIEQACIAIEQVSEQERQLRERKYARRRKMHYIDKLLNELEMLNLSEQVRMPASLSTAVDRLISDTDIRLECLEMLEIARPQTVGQAMDVLYEVQDSLMFGSEEEELDDSQPAPAKAEAERELVGV